MGRWLSSPHLFVQGAVGAAVGCVCRVSITDPYQRLHGYLPSSGPGPCLGVGQFSLYSHLLQQKCKSDQLSLTLAALPRGWLGRGKQEEEALRGNWSPELPGPSPHWAQVWAWRVERKETVCSGLYVPSQLAGSWSFLNEMGTVVILPCLWREFWEARIMGYPEGW